MLDSENVCTLYTRTSIYIRIFINITFKLLLNTMTGSTLKNENRLKCYRYLDLYVRVSDFGARHDYLLLWPFFTLKET